MLTFLMQIFYSQHFLYLCCYTGTVSASPQKLSQNLDSVFLRRLLRIRNLDLKKQGQVMLKRRLDCFQNLPTPADLRKDIWKPRQRKCTEINAFTPQVSFVHPRSPGFETQSDESKCRGFFKWVLQNVYVLWAGCRHNKKTINTGKCIWFV